MSFSFNGSESLQDRRLDFKEINFHWSLLSYESDNLLDLRTLKATVPDLCLGIENDIEVVGDGLKQTSIPKMISKFLTLRLIQE